MDKLYKIVDKYRQLILDAERYIWAHPETGYKEFETSKYLAEKFEQLGYKLTYAKDITGFYTVVDTGREGPCVLVLGELDSVLCPSHPEANKETGAVHACGHNAQCASLLGVAALLTEKEVLDNLCGKIKLCAVPAEELLEIEYRNQLVQKGIIKYLGGKAEFLSRGYFDDVDIAFMVHTAHVFASQKQSVGIIAKNIIYKGVAAHAGGSPHAGKNALYAANCGLNAINALRETFREKDYIRVHPIITNGGAIVNGIPDKVTLESYVRGLSYEAIIRENKKVNRAIIGSALSLGVNVEIVDIPGYAPLDNDINMINVAKEAFEAVFPGQTFLVDLNGINTGSTDMGDLSGIFPSIHPYCAGVTGNGHGSDYYIVDPEKACVMNACWQVCMIQLLLGNNATRAKDVIANFKPKFNSKEEYFDFIDAINSSGDRIVYNEDDTANVKL